MSASHHEVSRMVARHSSLIHLAWSLDREVSLSAGFFPLNGSTVHRHVVRVGVDSTGIAKVVGYFQSREKAEESFLSYAEQFAALAARKPGTFGGTPSDPDSIDVEACR